MTVYYILPTRQQAKILKDKVMKRQFKRKKTQILPVLTCNCLLLKIGIGTKNAYSSSFFSLRLLE